jgi:hypothetical protein
MSTKRGLVIRVATRFGVVTGGIHEGLSAQENCWDATIFEGQDVVHTVRYARASVADRRHNEVTPFGQLVDNGRLSDARIDEFGAMHGLCHAIFSAQPLGNVVQQHAGVLCAVVREPTPGTPYLCEPWGNRSLAPTPKPSPSRRGGKGCVTDCFSPYPEAYGLKAEGSGASEMAVHDL